MTPAWIALGGNLGPVHDTLLRAVEILRAAPDLRWHALSSILTTQPVGSSAGGLYANAAATFETALPPLDLLRLLQSVENQLGRVRLEHWGPRTLDLDLLFYGDQVLDLPDLKVPHPHLWYRRFVLDPLVEIAPHLVHPERGLTIAALRTRLLPRPLRCLLAGGTVLQQRSIFECAAAEFPTVRLSLWNPAAPPVPLVFYLGELSRDLPPASSTLWEALPIASRCDISAWRGGQVQGMKDVLRAALGE